MRTSCNGCRVLRKGCSDDCTIRPCLEWIKSPEAQANATVFLAKFFGRAGLLNLLNAGPLHLRPDNERVVQGMTHSMVQQIRTAPTPCFSQCVTILAIFQSLLYEACGRVVDPVYGSVGLLYSGQWNQCQEAVDCVLKGLPILSPPTTAVNNNKLYNNNNVKIRTQTGRANRRAREAAAANTEEDVISCNGGSGGGGEEEESNESVIMFSVDTTEEAAAAVAVAEAGQETGGESHEMMRLELTLGFGNF